MDQFLRKRKDSMPEIEISREWCSSLEKGIEIFRRNVVWKQKVSHPTGLMVGELEKRREGWN